MAYGPAMRVGLSVTTHHAGVAPAEAVARVVARASAAAGAGLDHLTLGDHHAVGPDGQYLQNVPLLGRLLADWPADRQAGLLLLVPLWHPVLAAEQVGTLAAMTGARFILQTGIGSGRAQFAAMGASTAERGWRTDAGIELIGRLLAGETAGDERLGVREASIRPVPAQPVEWWIGSGAADAAIERAARAGDAWYVSPGWTREELRPVVERYRRACDRHGRQPRIALRRDVHLAADDAAAVAEGDRLAAAGYRGIPREALVCGGPERAAELLEPFRALGVTDVVARCASPHQAAAVEAIGALGEVRRLLAPG